MESGGSAGSLGPVHSGKTAPDSHEGTELRVRSAPARPLAVWPRTCPQPLGRTLLSFPPGVDVKTVRLVCEKRGSHGSLGLQPALFSGLASCLWHGFGFWAVDKDFPPSSSLLRPSSVPLLLPPLSSACPSLSTSLCPHSPPDGIGGVDFNFC